MSQNPDSHASSDTGQEKRLPVLPILLFLLLTLAACYFAWQLWQKFQALNEESTMLEQRVESLENKKAELEKLLALPPCEAKMKVKGPEDKGRNTAKQEAGASQTGTAPAKMADSGQTDADQIEEACVFLVSLGNGKSVSTGSGFFVAPGYIVTNRHVVGSNPGKVLVTSKALGRPVAGRVLAISPEKQGDFALLAVKLPDRANVSSLKLAPVVKKTQKVGAWGFPDIIGKNDPKYAKLLAGADFTAVPELSYTEGVVSAVLERSPRIIAHTAPISPGNSGGPLLDSEGNVVGINTMITLDEDSYRQASLALDAQGLAKFLKEHGVEWQQAKP